MILLLNHLLNTKIPTYANTGKFEIIKSRSIENGDSSNESSITFSNHVGTHVDAPYHFDNDGKSLDLFPAQYWFCDYPWLIELNAEPGEIIDLDKILDLVMNIPQNTDILLLKTNFEKYRNTDRDIYNFQNPSIHPEVGIWLRKNRKLKFIGFDYISLSSRANREMGRVAHHAFLSSKEYGTRNEIQGTPILLIEDMKLSELQVTPKRIIISPLLFEKADGGPVTIFAEI